MRPFVDRLVEYIEGPCGQPHFHRRMAGYSEAELRSFEEKYFRGPIPAEYREFLLRMGKHPQAFKLKDDDMEGFEYVKFWYEDPAEDPKDPCPRGETIVIAIGLDETHYILDGTLPGRPVMRIEFGEAPARVADSFEHHCFITAWYLFKYKKLTGSPYFDFYAKPKALERALGAARGEGLSLEPFSEADRKYLSGPRQAVGLYRHGEFWRVGAAAANRAAAQELALVIVDGSGAMLPRTRSQ